MITLLILLARLREAPRWLNIVTGPRQAGKTTLVGQSASRRPKKIPNWSETVKGLWDQDRLARIPLHVILLGSAPLLMQRGLTESLAGRYEVLHLPHWSFAEMAAASPWRERVTVA